jgi:hypothetical protein
MTPTDTRYTFADLSFRDRGRGHLVSRLEFPNGYSASVVRGPHTYGGPAGLYEMAVMWGDALVYDTPVTSDVLGHLTEGDVTERLNEVARLPPRSP